MQEAALADGVLLTAQQNAASTIRSLLQGLGFEKMTSIRCHSARLTR